MAVMLQPRMSDGKAGAAFSLLTPAGARPLGGISATEVSDRTDSEAYTRRCLTPGGVRTVGAREMRFAGRNASWSVFGPELAGNKTRASAGNVAARFAVGAKVVCR
jgi:hypothetical protein